jgi:predicted ester cyclase
VSGPGLERVREYFDRVWNAHDLSTFDEFVSPDVLYHPPRGREKGYAGYRDMAERFMRAFSDLRFEILDAVEEDGLVALRIRIRGTHDGGEHLGVQPTGRRVDAQGRPWLRVRDGKVVEVWSLYDERGMLEQMGAFPARARAS